MNSGCRIWAENLGQYNCHEMYVTKQSQEAITFIFTLQTFNYFEASCLVMDALCNFHGNQDICQRAIKLCANLCAKVLQYTELTNPIKIAFLDRFFAQFDTQILEKYEKHPLFKMFAGTNKRGNANESLDRCYNLNNSTCTYPSPNPTLT